MATFRETRNTLLIAHADGVISDEEMALLYDVNRSKNLDFPFWKYDMLCIQIQRRKTYILVCHILFSSLT